MAFAVVTRDPGDAQAYAAVLEPLGLEVVAMPVTRTVPAADPDALTSALDRASYDAIFVASARAAQELARAVAAVATIRSTMPELPQVWAVGPATKRALEGAKLPAQVPPGVRDGAELARAFVARGDVAGKSVLVPRAEEGRLDAVDILRAAGVAVVEVVAYRTVAVAADDPAVARGLDLLVTGDAAVCALFAPSQVAALAAVLAARGTDLSSISATFCAIGETTAAAARSAGIRDIAVAPAPTPEGIALAVRSVYPA